MEENQIMHILLKFKPVWARQGRNFNVGVLISGRARGILGNPGVQ